MSRPQVVFIISLLQDLNTVRPIAYLAARETEADVRFLVSWKFGGRDSAGQWRKEINAIALELSATVEICHTVADAYVALQGHRGVLIAGADSDIPRAHEDIQEIFGVAPRGFLRVTLQHGLECVGFRQNREHIMAHGRNVTFGGDVVCSWMPLPELSALIASQRAKLWVTGPQMLLSQRQVTDYHPPIEGGMVCENLHSVRLNASGAHGESFLETFSEYCRVLGSVGEKVTLRPHPGGQYTVKKNLNLMPNVVLNNIPIYKVNIRSYEYCISAPSTVLVDMVLADVPVGVWRDQTGIMDARIYDGLTPISALADWMAFLRDVRLRREALLKRQQTFLDDIGILRNPVEVYQRFARLLVSATSGCDPEPLSISTLPPPAPPRRLLFFANFNGQTLRLSFVKPLRKLERDGEMKLFYAYEQTLRDNLSGQEPTSNQIVDWVTEAFDEALPDVVVACRYSGVGAEEIAKLASVRDIPLIYYADDDILNTPYEPGEQTYASHMYPSRIDAVRHLMSHSDLVYCSTRPLRNRFREYGFRQPMRTGSIYRSGEVLVPAEERSVTRIGYVGFDHSHDFAIAVPSVVRMLEENPTLEFELFGSISMPQELSIFGSRVRSIQPAHDYEDSMAALAARRWDIGIAPLVDMPFNVIRANTKWVEYTSVGAAVIATAGTIYDGCGSDGCALFAFNDDWYNALNHLAMHPKTRYEQVVRAQQRLRREFSIDMLRSQLLSMFQSAAGIATYRQSPVVVPKQEGL
ncbi:hypothetical protein ABGN05_29345 [Aquibium sp. LZ166]|uniref:Glycosyltransferase n=1 Tax=Aquibium pacificus TaxID=3153579 RepID=A0ABV3SW27_9HYPH